MEPRHKIKMSTLFSIFFGSEFLLSVGSLRDKTGPQPTKWPPAETGPRDTLDPKQGPLGPHFAPGGRKISLSPPDPQNSSKSRIAAAGGRTIETAKFEVAQHERGFDRPKKYRKLPAVKAETAPCSKHIVQPGLEPGTSPSLGGGPPQKNQ